MISGRIQPGAWAAALTAIALAAGCGHDATPSEAAAAERVSASQAGSSPQAGVALGANNPQLRFVKIAEVRAGAASEIAAATGKVSFNEDQTSRVGSPLSGRVEALRVKPGDRVKKGDPLLTLVSPDVEGALAETRAAEADVALASRTAERARGLYADQAIPKKDLVQAESDLVKAQAALERSRGHLDLLGLKADQHSPRFTLRSPIAGTVVERNVLPGTEVRADSGTPLLTIADLSRLWVLADIYERDLPLVQAGQKAEVRVASYPIEVFPARVEHVGEAVDPQTRTVKLRLSVENAEGKLKPEMFARVTLRLPFKAGLLTVPSQAVLSDGESSLVIASLGDGRFEKRQVEIASEQDGLARVAAGLRPGDRVVTEGALFLKAEIDNR